MKLFSIRVKKKHHAPLIPKVIHFLGSLSCGGAQAVGLAVFFAQALLTGTEHRLVIGQQTGVFYSTNHVENKLEFLRSRVFHEYQVVLPFIKCLIKNQPSLIVVHQHHLSIILACLIYDIFYVKPIIVLVQHNQIMQDWVTTKSSVFLWLRKILFTYAVRFADKIVTVCSALKEELIINYKLPEIIVEVIYNPVFPRAFFTKKSPRKNALISAVEIDASANILLFVGRLVPEKRLDFMFQALVPVFQKIPNTLLVVIGEGPCRDRWVDASHDLGISQNVKWLGFISDPSPYYYRARCLLLSSSTEGFPMVILEALALGCPVVSTECGGVREILDGLSSCRIVPLNGVDCYSEAVFSVLEESSILNKEKLIKAASAFSIEETTNRYSDLINRLLHASI